VDGPLEVHVDDQVEVVVGHVREACLRVDAGVRGQHGQAAQVGRDPFDDGAAGVRVPHVQHVGVGAASACLGALVLGQAGDRDACAVRRERLGDASPDTEGPSGDQRGAALQQCGHDGSPSRRWACSSPRLSRTP